MKTAETVAALVTIVAVVLAYIFRTKYPAAVARVGFIIIWSNAAVFFLKICLFALTKEGGERAVLLVTSVLALALVAFYWHRFWQMKRPDKI